MQLASLVYKQLMTLLLVMKVMQQTLKLKEILVPIMIFQMVLHYSLLTQQVLLIFHQTYNLLTKQLVLWLLLVVVGVSGDIRASEIITSGNVQAQGNFIGNVTGQVSTLSNHNTGGLSEGTNKYYTSTRVDSDFDARLATKNTGNLTEGGNLYYTTARADSDAKNAITVTDAGGRWFS